jgi:hypothetical protein
MDDKDHEFDKELAKIEIHATFAATAGSIFAALGITLFTFGLVTTLESVSKTGEQITIFLIVGSVYSVTGLLILFMGIGLLVAGTLLIPRKIDKL